MSSETSKRSSVESLPDWESNKSRIFLVLACLWPFLAMALFASSSPRVVNNKLPDGKEIASKENDGKENDGKENDGLRLNLRNVLDRVDIMGYGPTHPRIGVVVTGDASVSDKHHWVETVESIFSHTDLSRIFVVAVVVDGHAPDPSWETALTKIHSGQIPHLHGLRLDLHQSAKEKDEQRRHESKVYVMFNEEPRGITSSRSDGVEFIHILEQHHHQAGLKSAAEDIILVLVQAGAVITSRKWLTSVTQALIVPPPLLLPHDLDPSTVPLKLANAVAFNIEGSGKRTTFDSFLTPFTESATADELNLSSGDTYMAPVWNGAALAMRLETWRQLPVHDEALTEAWPANLDLSLALWLCADGMDMINTDDALVVKLVDPKLSPTSTVTAPLSPSMGARFAEAWMDEVLQRKFFHSYTHAYKELTYLQWQTYQAQARQSHTFVDDLAQKCRSLEWYMRTVNPHLQAIWEQPAVVDRQEPPIDSRHMPENENKQEAQPNAEIKGPESNMNNQIPEELREAAKEGGEKKDVGNSKEEEESVVIPPRREPKMPSKPLCEECLKIVQQAKPVNLDYVDVTGGHKEHPHLGAKDANGNLGYLHNETHLHLDPPKFGMSADDLISGCKRRDNNYRMLTEKVFVDFEGDKAANQALGPHGRAKIFCLVYTTEKGHDTIPRIRETWGQKCDGFMVGSTKTDPSIDAVEIPHEGLEDYDNIWQKVRSMWSYIYDNYYQKYDWFHIGGDDVYLLVENLRLYLESEEIRTASNGGMYLPDGTETSQTPLFLGRRFAYMGDMEDIFNSGGSGYTINKAALKTLVVNGLPTWRPHAHTFSEDTVVARLFKSFGILPYETKDENGGERYMPFMPGHHYGYRMPDDKSKDWYASYSINIKTGRDHCAAKSVAFHYVKGLAMYRLHAILYNLCPPGSLA